MTTNRLPTVRKAWPTNRQLPKIPTTEIGGQTCYDSRIEEDPSKRTPDWGVDMDTGFPWSTSQAKVKPARIWLVRRAESPER